MRVRHKPWAKDALAAHPEIVIEKPEDHKGKVQERFEKEQPLHVEIGTGKGQFIIQLAKLHPEWNFIGIENQASVIVEVLQKILAEGLTNIQLVNMDAANLQALFEEKTVAHIYLNFSDPWPKNRHEKRRLTYKSFLKEYEKVLKIHAPLTFKTDNRGLFRYSLLSFSQFGARLEDVSLDLHADDYPNNIQTEYEEKFSKKGNVIYLAEVIFPK